MSPLVRRISLAALAVALAGSRPARAEGLVLHATGAGARAFAGDQRRETGFGGAGSFALELRAGRVFGVSLGVGALSLAAGSDPSDATLAPRGAASALFATAGVRARPFGYRDRPKAHLGGLWLGAGAGAARTGGLSRPAVEAGLGWDFVVRDVGVGPYASWLWISQPDDSLRPDDAHVALVGAHATFGGAYPNVVVKDRDGDGLADDVDKCPDAPEDKDGFEDEDGCPDLDDDLDGIPDTVDACPREPGVATTDPRTNGCPDHDRDGDGIMDSKDRCPDQPEDKDGFEDEDGCPDPDNDKDGLLDGVDQCPDEAEVVNGFADDDGCPDTERVKIVGDKIELDSRVLFDFGKSKLSAEGRSILAGVAKLLADHPDYAHVDVNGHTDSQGPEGYNQHLSEDRAKSVLDELVAGGVARERLASHGFGKHQPRVPNRTLELMAQNRRVELVITRERKIRAGVTLKKGQEIEHELP